MSDFLPKDAMFDLTEFSYSVPVQNLARITTAKDVRTLRTCAECGHPGNADSMVDIDAEWLHGRCFVARFGARALAALPKAKQDRLMLGDIGVPLMKALCNYRGKQ